MTLFYILLIVQLADLASTIVALRNPKLSEANGPLSKLMAAIGTLPALLIVKAVAMGLIWHYQADIGQGMIALCGLYAVVIINNIRLIVRGH